MRTTPARLDRSLAALLVAMAVGQVVSFPTFLDALEGYDLGSGPAVVAGALALVVAEVAAGVGLWRSAGSRASALAVAVALVWSVLAVQAFARGLDVTNCGCFGRFFRQELRWWVLLEDAAMLGSAAWVHARRAHGGEVVARGPVATETVTS